LFSSDKAQVSHEVKDELFYLKGGDASGASGALGYKNVVSEPGDVSSRFAKMKGQGGRSEAL
jgi:hypothetical protein